MDSETALTGVGGIIVGALPTIIKAGVRLLRAKSSNEQSDKAKLWERIDALEQELRRLLGRIEALEHERLELVEKLASKEGELAILKRDREELSDALRQYEQQMAQCPNCRALAAQNAKGAHAG